MDWPGTLETTDNNGLRIAVEGCGHGTLHAIYASIQKACAERKWDGVDLVIIGGDFQAVRNAADLNVMSVPAKYRQLGDVHEYYSGARTAPYLTIFVAGNHEASSHLWELYYGGWVAPNIYYMGAANVLRLGPWRIAGLSGIWKGFDYRKQHHERLPFNADDIKSFYHVREIDVRKLLQLRTQVDIGISHDWPRGIEKHGNYKKLFKMKPDFQAESRDGTLGNPAAEYVLDRLRPRFWFSAHLHCKFAAIKEFEPPGAGPATAKAAQAEAPRTEAQSGPAANPDEIDLDLDEDDGGNEPATAKAAQAEGPLTEAKPGSAANPDEIDLDLDEDDGGNNETSPAAAETAAAGSAAPGGGDPAPEEPGDGGEATTEDLRAQLPAAFAKPAQTRPATAPTGRRPTPGQPVPPGITNTITRFLALDKCLPGRKFLQLLEIPPPPPSSESEGGSEPAPPPPQRPYRLQYDPEWLAIVRVFHPLLRIGDRTAVTPPDEGEARYAPRIDAERAWIEENVVAKNKLEIPRDFTVTAPPHRPGIDPERTDEQPVEWTNPQTTRFCEMLGIENLWHASEEERKVRRELGPPPVEFGGHRGGRGGFGRGGGRGRGGRGRGGGRGRRRY